MYLCDRFIKEYLVNINSNLRTRNSVATSAKLVSLLSQLRYQTNAAYS